MQIGYSALSVSEQIITVINYLCIKEVRYLVNTKILHLVLIFVELYRTKEKYNCFQAQNNYRIYLLKFV